VATLQSKITNFTNFVTDADNNNYNLLKKVSDNKSLITLGVKLVYGITIGIASLMLLGTLMVAFCDKTKCRYLMYSTCIILFLIGILGFFLSFVFSILAPVTFFGCQFINHSLSSASNFDCIYLLIQLISIKLSQIQASEAISLYAYQHKLETL
jgi:hypothetical protein